MQPTPPGHPRTLATIVDAEKVIAPMRARALLASLAQATTVPSGPGSVRDWSEAVLVVAGADGGERATFASAGAVPAPTDRGASQARHIDALRGAAVAMLWGRESSQGPDGLPRFPRLRKLLVDHWDDTWRTCDSPDKFMMFFEATLALDRASEPKAGRAAFNTLSVPIIDAVRKDVKVGTIGFAFDAIIDTGKFKKAQRPTPADAAPLLPRPQGPWPTPHVSSPVQSASPSPLPASTAPTASTSPKPGIFGVRGSQFLVGVIIVMVITGVAMVLWR